MKNAVKIFKALSDPSRLRILGMLQIRPLCVCEIKAILPLALSTVSKHLSILREAGLISDVKEQKWVVYHIETESPDRMIRDLLSSLDRWLADDAQIRADRNRVRTLDRHRLCQT